MRKFIVVGLLVTLCLGACGGGTMGTGSIRTWKGAVFKDDPTPNFEWFRWSDEKCAGTIGKEKVGISLRSEFGLATLDPKSVGNCKLQVPLQTEHFELSWNQLNETPELHYVVERVIKNGSSSLLEEGSIGSSVRQLTLRKLRATGGFIRVRFSSQPSSELVLEIHSDSKEGYF